MQNTLYLDTARMGRMSPQALDASIDFARFAHEHGSTLYFSQFLHEGFANWPIELQEQYRGLSNWDGISAFQKRVKILAKVDCNCDVFTASRSTFLMQCAAKLLVGLCRNVLITDCTWPAYARILRETCQQHHSNVTVCPIRQRIFNENCTADELIEHVVSHFMKQQCDGLFLPLIDNLGVRLPVERIVSEIKQRAELRFVVVDGAQAFGQVETHLSKSCCDFFIAGTHKWIRGHFPMGVGFCGQAASQSYITDSLRRWQESSLLADPLLNFTGELSGETGSRFGETVQVASLIVANAAVCEVIRRHFSIEREKYLVQNRNAVSTIACSAGWHLVDIAPDLQSNIMLIEPPNHNRSLEETRATLQSHFVAATVYSNSVVRISLPHERLIQEELNQLRNALSDFASKRLFIGRRTYHQLQLLPLSDLQQKIEMAL